MKWLSIFTIFTVLAFVIATFCFIVSAPLVLSESNQLWLLMYIPYSALLFIVSAILFDNEECEECENVSED